MDGAHVRRWVPATELTATQETADPHAPSATAGSVSPFAAIALTELLVEVQTRLDVLARAQVRVQDLLDAFLTVSTGLDLESTLERIVQAAVSLVDARYGALGVLRSDGEELDTFVTVGMDAAGHAPLGQHPHGKGILGRLITDPRPLRLAELSSHPASVGIPAGHPPMRSFLGVPIRAHGRVFGNLYLTEKGDGAFSEEDEALLSALAGAAGIAIENARSFQEGELRRRWLSAVGDVRTVLDGFGAEAALQVVADRVVQLSDADAVWLLREVDAEQRIFKVVSVAGAEVEDSTGARIGPADCGLLATLPGGPVITTDLAAGTGAWPDPDTSWGPVIVARLPGNDSGPGLVLAARHAGRAPFGPALSEMMGSFAAQVALALDAETRQQVLHRLDLFEERERIGRDLHDHVIQRLYATGVAMQALSVRIGDDGMRDKLVELIGQLDQTVHDIRTRIFDLHPTDETA